MVALPETDQEGALELAERIRERIEATQVELVDGEGFLTVTASVGLATQSGATVDVRRLIGAADGALYEAKRSGKNRVVVAAQEAETACRRRRAAGEGSGALVAKVAASTPFGGRFARPAVGSLLRTA